MTRGAKWMLLVACTALAAGMVFTPAWLIQPFRPQTDRGMEISHALRQLSPLLTIIVFLVAATLAFTLWRGARWWNRSFLVVLLILTAVSAWLARQNHFEWMFNPLLNPAYASAGAAGFVGATDLVLAVERSGDSAAYPIRQLAYHHLVQDTVGRVPIVVTY